MSSPRSRINVRAISLLAFTCLVSLEVARADVAIIGGVDTQGDEFPEVFAITSPAGDGSPGVKLCTGVLVHPRVLVTAAHCLPEDSTIPVTVIEGRDARSPAKTYVSIRTARNSAYFSTRNEIEQTGFDIGVVVLAADLPGADTATGAKLAPLASITNSSDRDAAHRNGVYVVGYGGKYSTRTDGSTGTKRWSRMSVIESSGAAFSTSGFQGAISRGDSGGPAFLVDSDGKRRLIGIASGAPKSQTGSFTDGASISLYAGMRPRLAAWIEKMSGISLSSRLPQPTNPHGADQFGAK